MKPDTPGIDAAEEYAAQVELPARLTEWIDSADARLIRAYIRSAYAAGVNRGLQISMELIKKSSL